MSTDLRTLDDGKGPWTTAELAARWRCSRRVVEDRIRDGLLIATKPIDRWRIDPEAIIQYEKARQNRQPVERPASRRRTKRPPTPPRRRIA